MADFQKKNQKWNTNFIIYFFTFFKMSNLVNYNCNVNC